MAASVSRKLIKEEAVRRGWQTVDLEPREYFYQIIDNNGRSEIFMGSRPLLNSANGTVITKNKDFTLRYITSQGYAVPEYAVVRGSNEVPADLLAKYDSVVVKPDDGMQSRGVTVGITEPAQLAAAIELALSHSRTGKAMIQRELHGKLYRLFVINGNMVAAAVRKPAEVVGDGRNTVRQLIGILNQDPLRGDNNDSPQKKIKTDQAEAFLGESGMSAVPAEGEIVIISAIASVSAGGSAVNVTDLVHSDWHEAVRDLSAPIGLFVAGYDVICDDISQPLEDRYLPLLEINSAPGLKLHHFPTGGGEPIDLASILLDEVFGIAKNR